MWYVYYVYQGEFKNIRNMNKLKVNGIEWDWTRLNKIDNDWTWLN